MKAEALIVVAPAMPLLIPLPLIIPAKLMLTAAVPVAEPVGLVTRSSPLKMLMVDVVANDPENRLWPSDRACIDHLTAAGL
jgi:hypothetical protein